MIPSCQTCPGCISSAPSRQSFIMPSHAERGEHGSCISAVHRLPGTGARGHCIISWLFYTRNTSSALTSWQLIHLISTELIYCESPGLYHRYNQVHVYKISYGTQCLKWSIQRIGRVIQRIVLMGHKSGQEEYVYKILLCIFHNQIFRSPALRAFEWMWCMRMCVRIQLQRWIVTINRTV